MNASNFSTAKLMPIYLGIGVGLGLTVFCTVRARRRQTLMARTRRHAGGLARDMATGLSCIAAEFLEKGRVEMDRQKKGLREAVEAGMKAYLHSVA